MFFKNLNDPRKVNSFATNYFALFCFSLFWWGEALNNFLTALFCFFLIISFGISHGALDNEKGKKILKKFKVKNDVLIVSAHRTPDRLFKFAKNAHKNYSVICAGAGRAAHLAGMCASLTKIPVIGVPIKDKKTDGISALFSVA